MHGLDRQHRTSEITCASWLLTGMPVSVNQHELPDWRRLHKMVSDTVKMLPMIEPTMLTWIDIFKRDRGHDIMSETAEWPDPADKAYALEQAMRVRDQAAAGGLIFEAYLPPDLAVWLLDRIERGAFVDPSEATFVLLGEARDLEPHVDLRNELLKRVIQAAIDDPRPGIPVEDVMESLRKKFENPLPEPAKWERRSGTA